MKNIKTGEKGIGSVNPKNNPIFNYKNKYLIITRDWKGKYDLDDAVGMILVGGEEDIETGGDCFAMVFSENKTKRSAQEIYDIHQKLDDDDVEGFAYDDKDEYVVIEI